MGAPIPFNAQITRVDYIDLLKGFCILWVIWFHTDYPGEIAYMNPIFSLQVVFSLR